MNIKNLLLYLVKLILCGLIYSIGFIAGGMVAAMLHLPQPALPQGATASSAATGLVLASPLMALALALISRRISGGWLTRALMLWLLTFVSYTLNTLLDASLYVTGSSATSPFTIVSALPPSLLIGSAVAWLFPPREKGAGFIAACRAFFNLRSAGQWLWRLALAALAFMPVYLLFGELVNPFTYQYYQQNMYGLHLATWDEILPILFLRSVLFLAACLPVIIAWQASERSLLLILGTSLFILVGLIYMLISSWLPLSVRIPHSIEMLADEFVYAALLVWLLRERFPFFQRKPQPVQG